MKMMVKKIPAEAGMGKGGEKTSMDQLCSSMQVFHKAECVDEHNNYIKTHV